MLRRAAVLLAIVVLAGCGNSIRTKERVQEAIVHRLETASGLDMNSLDVTTTAVTFERNRAYATVAFHPKNDPRVNSDMVMKYTLEARDGKWVVVNVADSQGHGMTGHGAASGVQLPPGHPPLDASPHPPVTGSSPATGPTQ
ncbi:MAG: hypothetical protein JO033_11785 [Acidobacteriaceae bacterium]|nr:hypothetical protein [Acidobacteriaceae bacterium]MBV9499191.1 hypothetical protein [Acidobacteriaceae bacterium]